MLEPLQAQVWWAHHRSVFAVPAIASRQDPVTIQFWGGEPEENGPGDMVAAFNESQAEYQAVYTRYVNDDTGNTQLDTALQGGTEIDVYQSYGIPRTSQRIGAGAALDLTELHRGRPGYPGVDRLHRDLPVQRDAVQPADGRSTRSSPSPTSDCSTRPA